ncbi:MAG TPA: TonB family protein [Vicinamibacterales bacterium]|nr:TonB family protein [Vicinamibacterales bacterium]
MRCVLLALLFVVAAVAPVRAADSLDAARELYAAAAYDEALAMLQRLQQSPDPPSDAELQQERALCLLALNRSAEAEEAIAAVVKAQPLYIPDPSLVSPRVRAAFLDVRRRLTPEIAREYFARGREHFERKDYERAVDSFEVVLELTREVDAAGDPSLGDVRTLAEGFRTLSQAAIDEAERARAEAEAAAAAAAAAEAEAKEGEEELAVARVFDHTSPGVTAPVIIKQQVPEWRPFMGTPPGIHGLMSITIDERGRVERAEILRSLHPAYDRRLLQAAADWSYEPATRNGQPVKFRKVLRLTLR